jgi:succinate dehydrogenase/fumarate reductase flavoprotein subunit
MAYIDTLRESVIKLEKTRDERLRQEIPILSSTEKEDLIRGFHPDYQPGRKRELSLGVDEGTLVPCELCDIMEARSLIDPDEIDLTTVRHSVDVLVVGGGGGGATAAYFAHQHGANVLLATKLRFGDSSTIMAEGGINACVSPGDSPIRYYIDTMGGGSFTNVPDLVKTLSMDSPRILRWLENLGVPFDKEPDGRVPKATFRLGGGHSRPRVHSVGDYTGMSIMQTLRDEIRNQGIEVLEFSPVVELLLDREGRCTGAVFMDIETKKPFIIKAKKTILATGGLGRLHLYKFPTTNHYGATADGIVVGYRAGVRLAHIDSVQFHPTGGAYPEQLVGFLVSEGLRGRGAHLVNVKGERFINELETRDTVSAAIIREVTQNKNGVLTPTGMLGVWLDSPVIDIIKGKGTIKRYLKHLHHQYLQYNIDIEREPVLIYPAQHYQNGGFLSDGEGQSSVEGLYVIGEVAGGVHGRNRLGGNSLIDIFVFGRRAGIDAAEARSKTEFGEITLDHVRKYNQQVVDKGLDRGIRSPLLLPDYRYEKALSQVYQ